MLLVKKSMDILKRQLTKEWHVILKFRRLMMSEKKTYYTEARKRANEKYLKESVEDVRIRVPKGQKQLLKLMQNSKGNL